MHLSHKSADELPANGRTDDNGCLDKSSSDDGLFFEDNLSAYNWTDVTKEFTDAAKTLQLGELVHDARFSLFEAMSAIELMDPKMDGFTSGACSSERIDFDKAVEIGKVKLSNLSPNEILDVMDATFSALISWFEGRSLAQTLFINLYLHKPLLIEDRLLKPFCLAILKLVGICCEITKRANVFEEEDFHLTLDNFDLASSVSNNRIMGMLKEAEEDCQKFLRSAKGKHDKSVLQKIQDHEELLLRLRFIRHFTMSLIALTVKEEKENQNIPGPLPKKQSFDEAVKCLQMCEENLRKIKTTTSDAKCIESLNKKFIFQHIDSFDLSVNQNLMPPTLPRFVSFLLPSKVVEYLRKLIDRLLHIASRADHLTTFKAALEFFRTFSRTENCILSRSVLQIAYLPRNYTTFTKTPLVDVIKESIRDFVNPSALNPLFNLPELEDCKPMLDEFFDNCTKIFVELLRAAGHNRARQRHCYAVLLEEFGSFQDEAERLDSMFHNILIKQFETANANSTCSTVPVSYQHMSRFSSYIIYHVLKCMLEYLTLGFELELYASHEYAFIFWYLNEILFKWVINVLSKVDCILYAQDQGQQNTNLAKSKVDKKKQKQKKKSPVKTWHQIEILQLQSYQKMCDGYYKAMLGFHAVNRIPLPIFSNSDQYDAIRCEHRLAPFFNLSSPPMISYQQFIEISNFKQIIQFVPCARLFSDSAHAFDEARLCLENVPLSDEVETSNLIKVCKLNCVVLKLLATGTQDSQTEWPKFEFSPHKIFPVIKLK